MISSEEKKEEKKSSIGKELSGSVLRTFTDGPLDNEPSSALRYVILERTLDIKVCHASNACVIVVLIFYMRFL